MFPQRLGTGEPLSFDEHVSKGWLEKDIPGFPKWHGRRLTSQRGGERICKGKFSRVTAPREGRWRLRSGRILSEV